MLLCVDIDRPAAAGLVPWKHAVCYHDHVPPVNGHPNRVFMVFQLVLRTSSDNGKVEELAKSLLHDRLGS